MSDQKWVANLDKKYLVLSINTKPGELYVNASIVIDLLNKCNEELVKVREQRDEANANYQFMVERACNEKLDGYRELADKVAYAENDRDDLHKKLNETIEQKNKLYKQLLSIQDELDRVRARNIELQTYKNLYI
jgi:uncharacterized coiled-coil DUF342 family protein